MTPKRRQSGQAILEYILMTVMLAVIVAVIIRNSNLTIYQFWTGLTRQVAAPCADCSKPDAPSF